MNTSYTRLLNFTLLAILLCSNKAFSQTEVIDTLIAKIDTTTSLIDKAKLLTDLSQKYWYKDAEKAVEYGKEALHISELAGDTTRIAYALNTIGYSYKLQSNYVAASSYLIDALKLLDRIGDKGQAMKVGNNLGTVYNDQGNYRKALSYFIPYYKYNQQADSLVKWLAHAAANTGVAYYQLGIYDSALYYQRHYLSISSETGDKLGIAIATSNLADVYYAQENYGKALLSYKQSYGLSKEIDDTEGEVITLKGQAQVWLKRQELERSIEYFRQALELAKANGYSNYEKEIYQGLSQAYREARDYYRAFVYQNKFIALKDSLFNKNNSQQLHALEESYLVAKKEAEINQNQAELARNQAEIELLNKSEQLTRIIVIMLSAGLLLFGALAIGLYRNNKIKQRINKQLQDSNDKVAAQSQEIQQHNVELQQQKEEILAQRDAINDQNITLEKAFKEIHKQNDNITASINYAQRIQTAMLPSHKQMMELLGEHMLLNKPRDIVSGDFYFIQKVGGCTVIAVADCTGHGVSGGFMSMIGNELLNEVVRVQQITEVDRILEHLDRGIRSTLKQEETKNRDGMDVACCAIYHGEKRVSFAGAKRPMVYIDSNGELQVIKGSRRGIGGFTQLKSGKTRKKMPFQVTNLAMQDLDSIYLFSDGYQDQFSSRNTRKIGVKRMSKLFLKMNEEGIAWGKKQEYLDQYWAKWRGSEKQIDDILVLGFSVGDIHP